MTLEEIIRRQRAFSSATFGPGARTNGLIEHIRKELVEIEDAADAKGRTAEWIDVLMLAVDGLWRSKVEEGADWWIAPEQIVQELVNKIDINEQRKWPDWRSADPEKAIEHIREGEAS